MVDQYTNESLATAGLQDRSSTGQLNPCTRSIKNISTIIQSIRMVDDIILILMIIQSILSAIM